MEYPARPGLLEKTVPFPHHLVATLLTPQNAGTQHLQHMCSFVRSSNKGHTRAFSHRTSVFAVCMWDYTNRQLLNGLLLIIGGNHQPKRDRISPRPIPMGFWRAYTGISEDCYFFDKWGNLRVFVRREKISEVWAGVSRSDWYTQKLRLQYILLRTMSHWNLNHPKIYTKYLLDLQ